MQRAATIRTTEADMKVIDEGLLDEFRSAGRCEFCGKHFQSRHPHHLWARGMGGGSRLDVRINIIALCPPCHNATHAGIIMRPDLLAVVAAREGLLQSQIEEEIWRLRRTPK